MMEGSILSSSMPKSLRRFSEVWPVPKSSMEIETPRSVRGSRAGGRVRGLEDGALRDVEAEGLGGDAAAVEGRGDHLGEVRVGLREGAGREVHRDLESEAGAPPVAGGADRELDHALREPGHEPSGLGEAQEVRGLDYAALGMDPAGEGLDAAHAGGAQVGLG
jgi:hypothetical protein